MIYVASPYTSPLSGDLKLQMEEQRYRKAMEFVMYMLNTEGIMVFSPIVYGHPIAKYGQLPTDASFWHKFNMTMLRRAEAIFVLMLPGWETSKGLKVETETASVLGIPMYHFTSDFKRMEVQ